MSESCIIVDEENKEIGTPRDPDKVINGEDI